jgi:hypothetical protein
VYVRVDKPTSENWVTVRTTADFTSTSGTLADVPGLAFTPSVPNATYEVEVNLYVETTNTSAGVRWLPVPPTGTVRSGYRGTVPLTQTTETIRYGPLGGTEVLGVGFGLANQVHPAGGWLMFLNGANPSGDFKVQAAIEAAEAGLQTVTIRTGSNIRYRIVPTSVP